MTDTFEHVANWIQRAALANISMEELVEGLCAKLNDHGVPVSRISIGRLLSHPVVGIVDVTWDNDNQQAEREIYPRTAIGEALRHKSPFGDLLQAAQSRAQSIRHLCGLEFADEMPDFPFIQDNLTNPETRRKYPVYSRLAESGITGYAAFVAPFGLSTMSDMRGTDFFPGASVSYSTKRKSGFTALEFEGFRRMAVPLMATARIVTERFFTSELLEAYLGRRSGQSVLNGQIGRGEVRRINCALLYSDMWGSTALSQQMSPEAFLATLNRYFDCVAGAVLDHGGEVLKFIGDGLLAIFPFEDTRQSREDICATALLVAREAFDHSARIPDADKVKFGIALHAGEVIYGNVGTEKRLDFTVTGSAVAKVSRVEGLTRKLDAQLLATDTFARYLSEPAQHLGGFDLRGFDKNVEVVSYDISPQP